MSKFTDKVVMAVRTVPFGQVASYGQIAHMVGVPRGARQVGWVLRSYEDKVVKDNFPLPWWRIINNAGKISIKGTKYHTPEIQKNALEKEGVKVSENLEIDIELYRFRPSQEILKKLELDDEYIFEIVKKFTL